MNVKNWKKKQKNRLKMFSTDNNFFALISVFLDYRTSTSPNISQISQRRTFHIVKKNLSGSTGVSKLKRYRQYTAKSPREKNNRKVFLRAEVKKKVRYTQKFWTLVCHSEYIRIHETHFRILKLGNLFNLIWFRSSICFRIDKSLLKWRYSNVHKISPIKTTWRFCI